MLCSLEGRRPLAPVNGDPQEQVQKGAEHYPAAASIRKLRLLVNTRENLRGRVEKRAAHDVARGPIGDVT